MAYNKPSSTKNKYNLDSDNEASRQLATNGVELVSVLVTAGGGSAAVRVHDSASGAGPTKDSILITANAGESTPYCPVQPVLMEKGLFVIIEQGVGVGAEAFVTYR